MPAGSVELILSYCHHALTDKSLRELLPYLREKGVAAVNGSVLSMGLLTNKVGVNPLAEILGPAKVYRGMALSLVTAYCLAWPVRQRRLVSEASLSNLLPAGPPDRHPASQEVQ